MKVGDLVRTDISRPPWGKALGIIGEEDPKSLHGPGWWIELFNGDRVSRHPGDIEVVNESR